MIALLLTGNEHRGNDATGMAFLQADGTVSILKKDIPAWQFVSSKEYEDFIAEWLDIDTRAVILHARGASQGNPRINDNNHPMYAGNTAVIHNGSIQNDHTLFAGLQLERKAETDSDILRAILDKYGFTDEAYKVLNRINGSIAGAALSHKYPDKMLLFRSGSPMTLASTNDHLMFSSLKTTLHAAAKPVVQRFGIPFQVQKPDLAFSLMPNHTLWILGPNGLEGHREFKTLNGRYQEPIRRVYKEYKERSEKWDRAARPKIIYPSVSSKNDESVDLAWCEKCEKEWVVPKGKGPKGFYCNKKKGGCGNELVALPGPEKIHVIH